MKASEFDVKFEAGEDLTQNLDLARARRVNRGQARVFCYIVGDSRNPDDVRPSAVPFQIDEGEIFFGPCMKSLRERMRACYLTKATESAEPRDDVYVVGFNGSNERKICKIVWIGRLMKVMTFAHAWKFLDGSRYEAMREWKYSPVHVRPIRESGRFLGYEHVNPLHSEDDRWVNDLVNSESSPHVEKFGKRLLLKEHVSAWQGFPRDACFLLENIFFATGRGLEIDAGLLSILQAVQPDRAVDRYAVFGWVGRGDRKRRDGKRGNYLPVTGAQAREFANWIRRRCSVAPGRSRTGRGLAPVAGHGLGRC